MRMSDASNCIALRLAAESWLNRYLNSKARQTAFLDNQQRVRCSVVARVRFPVRGFKLQAVKKTKKPKKKKSYQNQNKKQKTNKMPEKRTIVWLKFILALPMAYLAIGPGNRGKRGAIDDRRESGDEKRVLPLLPTVLLLLCNWL